jgi:hypothetical protein
MEQERIVPRQDWAETLLRFDARHRGHEVRVEVEAGGAASHALRRNFHCELGRIDMRSDGAAIRLILRRQPGARLHTLELAYPARVVAADGGMLLESANGHRVAVQVTPT